MLVYSQKLTELLQKWPGKKIFGVYRFLPIFFIAGALLEFSMINWQVGQVNFYRTYKKRVVSQMIEEKLRQEQNEKL